MTNQNNKYDEIYLWVNNLTDKYSMNKLEFKNSKLIITGNYLIITEILDDSESSTIFDLKNIIKYKTK